MIPKIIHLVFLREEESFPELFSDCMGNIKEMHPDWEVKLWNDTQAQEILKKHLPDHVEAYNTFKHNVQKADFIRLVLIYVYGGFYMDLDMLPLKPLDELRKHELVLGEEKTICDDERNFFGLRHNLLIANYMFGGISGHPFWLAMIDRLAALAETPVCSQQALLDITGPGLLTNTYHEQICCYPEIKLLRNFDKKCLQPYHNAVACHFGDYAAHLHAGTWRHEVPEDNFQVKK